LRRGARNLLRTAQRGFRQLGDYATLTTDTTFDAARQPASTLSPGVEHELVERLLSGVSRTFALTIPQLPKDLRRVVAVAYLLCRIVDTIEDEPALSIGAKRRFCELFVSVVDGLADAERLSTELAPLLSGHALPAEHELIREIPRVVGIVRGFSRSQQRALGDCVAIMSEGMVEFQANADRAGLADLAALDRYCYHVAGVVGEMLTRLFCEHSPAIDRNRDELMSLAVSFGQGLQMTNILKDLWEDLERGTCWLPRTVFAEAGFDVAALARERYSDSFGRGLARLIAIAHGHLRDALRYTLLIPAGETGIRNFCLWAIGMALLTLRKIDRHRDFRSGDQVKISRASVRATVAASRIVASHDAAVRALFRVASLGLPALPRGSF
jgi:farnesyl-diphosphate farnesyltransferase